MCEAFAAEVEKRTQRRAPYRGESLASIANAVFVELLKAPKNRKQLGETIYEEVWARQGHKCNLCGCVGAPAPPLTFIVRCAAPRTPAGE